MRGRQLARSPSERQGQEATGDTLLAVLNSLWIIQGVCIAQIWAKPPVSRRPGQRWAVQLYKDINVLDAGTPSWIGSPYYSAPCCSLPKRDKYCMCQESGNAHAAMLQSRSL